MPTSFPSILQKFRFLGVVLLCPSLGCITLRAEHLELVDRVDELSKRVETRDKQLKATLTKADEQLELLLKRVAEAEGLLRNSQAGLGVRVENLETDLAEVRGAAEDGQMESAAVKRNIEELRSDLDARILGLETKLNAVSNVPEGKAELIHEADKFMNSGEFSDARRLYRAFVSRYPTDAKSPEIRFKIGLTLYNQQDYRSAQGEFYWIKQNEPKSTVIHDVLYYLGLTFAKLGQCKKAIPYFEFLTKRKTKAPKRYKDKAKQQIKTLKSGPKEICTDS